MRGRRFPQGDGELGLAGFGGIVEDVAGAVAFGGLKEESALDAVGQSGEAGFAVDVGADLEVEFVGAQESIGDVDCDFSEIDGLVVRVGDREVGGAGAQGAVDDRDGLGVWGLGQSRCSQKQSQQDRFHAGAIIKPSCTEDTIRESLLDHVGAVWSPPESTKVIPVCTREAGIEDRHSRS